jgi:hypothetical protein
LQKKITGASGHNNGGLFVLAFAPPIGLPSYLIMNVMGTNVRYQMGANV